MKTRWGSRTTALLTIGVAQGALAELAACGAAVTATPSASSSSTQVQPTLRHGNLGEALVLSDGGDGRLEATALALRFSSTIAFTRGTARNVCGAKLKLRNAGATLLHIAAVGASSVLFDAGGWRYNYPGDNPRSALREVDLGAPGDSRAGWVYFTWPATGAAPHAFRYTVRSSDLTVTAEGDAGQWRRRPGISPWSPSPGPQPTGRWGDDGGARWPARRRSPSRVTKTAALIAEIAFAGGRGRGGRH